MYPSKRHTEFLLLALSISLLFAPHGIAQPEATSDQLHQSSDDKSQSQSTSSSMSDLTPTTAVESTNQYNTNDAIAELLKAHKQHNQNNLGQEKATDSSSQPSFKGYVRKFQQYQTLPEAAVTQEQTPTRQNFYTPDYSGVLSQPQQTQLPTPNGYLQQQVPYPDQCAPYAVPQPGLYDPSQYPRYVQPVPGNVNQYRFPRVTPWRFFGGGCL